MSDKKTDQGSWERRDFLKLGATGMVVTLAGCAAPARMQTAPEATTVAGESMDEAEAPAPDIGNLVDPDDFPFWENWQEPWTWRPDRWPGEYLELNIVRNQNPGDSPSPGNPLPSLFSYNGASPGPTIRVRSDGVVHIRLRNQLGLNRQETRVGPNVDLPDMTPDMNAAVCRKVIDTFGVQDPDDPEDCFPPIYPDQLFEVLGTEALPGWALKGHLNGVHAAHTTNLHTHGLHVRPQKNDDGSHSDNVFLRVIPQQDWEMRRSSRNPELHSLAPHEHVGQLEYTIHLDWERQGTRVAHPPGTHWYHPHSHGSTHDQVASGMAGFLVVEGDVDAAINQAMTGEDWPDPESAAGPYNYRERLMFIQRVVVNPADKDAGRNRPDMGFPPAEAVRGAKEPGFFRMRPGAVERWRVLNGSADGGGTKRFMVLDGQYVQRQGRMWRVVVEGDGNDRTRRLEPVTDLDIENAKLPLQQLSFDGITRVVVENGQAVHRIKDLSLQNAGTRNPFASDAPHDASGYKARLRAFESVFRNGDSLRRAFVRPNEVYLTNGNRVDLFFRAPTNAAGRIFTVFAKEAHIHTDNFQRYLQRKVDNPDSGSRREPFDVVVGYIQVRGEAVPGGDFDIQSLNAHLPDVPSLLRPVTAEELRIPAAEAGKSGARPGSLRCRTLAYTGTGGADFPLVEVHESCAMAQPELEHKTWAVVDGTRVLLAPMLHTMAINTEFDLLDSPQPLIPRKFSHDDERRPRVLVDTAEEWAVYNTSQMMWCHRDRRSLPQAGSYGAHYPSYPLGRAEGQRRNAQNSKFMMSAKGNDHPFHIHINPIWVLRIEVPDENGQLHNVLPEPVWMDTVAIPRNGGRVVFRTRFEDFTGKWVNHCHVLAHEDMGMMQEMECVADPREANYHSRDRAAEHAMPAAEVDAIYPPPDLATMYRQNMSFVDPTPLGYQEFPGFELDIPDIADYDRQLAEHLEKQSES
jgi:FtsP/CotA-like multicopper oxidase with cupredoxin domain